MTRSGMLRSTSLLALLASLAACDSPTVPPRSLAYNFVFEQFGAPIIYRWADGETIGVYVVPTDDAERAGVLEAAVRHAIGAWNDVVLFGEFRLVEAELDRADVVIAWANETLPLDTDECLPAPGGVAWTTFCLNEGVDTDDVANADQPLREVYGYPLADGEHREDGVHMIVQVLYNGSNLDDVPGLVTHEIGHVLGIGRHPCDYADVGDCPAGYGAHESLMYIGIPSIATPARADRETVEVLYRTRPHLVP
jgi:hypothetical protein